MGGIISKTQPRCCTCADTIGMPHCCALGTLSPLACRANTCVLTRCLRLAVKVPPARDSILGVSACVGRSEKDGTRRDGAGRAKSVVLEFISRRNQQSK